MRTTSTIRVGDGELAATAIVPRFGAVKDMAAYAGLSEKTIRNLIAAGELPSHKVGRRVLIAFADLDAYIRSKAQ